jgi:hypothetical protein
MLQWLYKYVANVCSQCFIYFFKHMLQVCLSGCSISFTHVASVLSRCYYVYNGSQVFQVFFLQVFRTHVSSVSSVNRYMLQVLYLDVSKVDRVLHTLQCDPTTAAAGKDARGSGRGHSRRVGSSGGTEAVSDWAVHEVQRWNRV